MEKGRGCEEVTLRGGEGVRERKGDGERVEKATRRMGKI